MTTPSPPLPPSAVVAHRGDAVRCLENTLPALEAAFRAGARYAEIDVQLTADGTPVLLHDATLERTHGLSLSVFELEREQLAALDTAPRPAVPTLAAAIARLRAWPDCRLFVEIKSESLRNHGNDVVVRNVLQAAAPATDQCIFISFAYEALTAVRSRTAYAIGWVLPGWSADVRQRATALAPEFLFCDYRRPGADEALWPGPWQWCLYDISDPRLAAAWHARGAHLIEGMDVNALLGRSGAHG